MPEKEAALAAMRRVIDAVNSGENTLVLNGLSESVVIVDDVAPYQWRGRAEAEQWLRRLASTRSKLNAQLSIEAADVQAEGGRAYVVAPGVLRAQVHQADVDVNGLLTLVLDGSEGDWLVDSLIWSVKR